MISESIILFEKVSFTVVTVAIGAFCIVKIRKLDGLSRRFLLAGFFYSVHELSFFLNDPALFELTKVMFFLIFFYSLVHIISLDEETRKRLGETERLNAETKKRLERLKENI